MSHAVQIIHANHYIVCRVGASIAKMIENVQHCAHAAFIIFDSMVCTTSPIINMIRRLLTNPECDNMETNKILVAK